MKASHWRAGQRWSLALVVACASVDCGGQRLQPSARAATDPGPGAEARPAPATSLTIGPYEQLEIASVKGEVAQLARFAGVFYGEIMSGEEMVAATTHLTASSTRLRGTYTFGNDELEHGVLRECQALGETKLTCIWQDAYGVGSVELSFDAAFEGFTGAWWPQGEPEQSAPWNGAREGEQPSEESLDESATGWGQP